MSVCPGETACDRFQSASGKTHKAKVKNACSNCSLLPTKSDDWKKSHKSLTRLVMSAIRLRNERQAGYSRPLTAVRNIEFETLLIVEQIVEQEQMALQLGVKAILMGIAGIKEQ